MRWCLYIMFAIGIMLACAGCSTPGARPLFKSGKQRENEKIQKQAIELKIQLEALQADLNAIATSTDHIKDANDDIADETVSDSPDIPKIAAGSQIIDNEIGNIETRTDNAAGLTKDSHGLARDIQKEAQGKFYFSRFWLFMFKCLFVVVVFAGLNYYVPFFRPIQKFLTNLLGTVIQAGKGVTSKAIDMALDHANASDNVDNNTLPIELVAEMKKAEIRKLKEDAKG